MKKNFFKKLSFVLALAMIISVVAPAAGAFAASKIKLNATSKTLHLGVDGKDEYNFNISSKKGTGWKYAWESTNENVVVVNKKNGVVTATGVGTAKVTVFVTDKDGNEVGDATATVTVRDNIKELTITNKPAGDKLAVGAANDFNRSFKTVSGSTKVTSAITRWTVEPADGASIDDKGVFTATKAGEYTITARAFQSKAKYNDWKADPAANAAYLLADDTYKVTVAASMVGAKQVDLDCVNVTFDAPMTDVDKNIAVYQLVGETKVKQLIKEVKMDDAKKVATVTMYVPFVEGATYVVSYDKMDDVSFQAATTKVEDVKSIAIITKTAVVGKDTDVEVKVYNEAGVDITTSTLSAHVKLSSNNEVGTYLDADNKKITIFTKGLTATVKAKFHTYKYDNLGNELGTLEAVQVITGVDDDATNITGLNAWTIVKSDPKFSDVKQKIAAGDSGYKLYVQFNTQKGKEDPKTVDNTGVDAGKFEFKSSDETVLIVNPLTGELHPIKEGSAVVVVKYGEPSSNDKTPIGAITIVVSPKRTASNLTFDKYSITLSNTLAVNDSAKVKLTLTDQLGEKKPFTTFNVKKLAGPSEGDTNLLNRAEGDYPAPNDGTGEVTFYGAGKKEGSYTYQITAGDLSRVVEIAVHKANSATPASYRLELSSTSVDLKAKDEEINKELTISVFGYSSNGVKVTKEDIGSTFVVKVDAPTASDGSQKYDKTIATDGKYDLVTAVSGGVIDKVPVGSFRVTLTRIDGTKEIPSDAVYFTTTDSQDKPVLSKVKTQIFTDTVTDAKNKTDAGLIAAAKACFEIKLNGADVTSNIIEVEADGSATSIFVKSVTVQQSIKLSETTYAYIKHKVDINTLIKK